jgi:hypothetical protein
VLTDEGKRDKTDLYCRRGKKYLRRNSLLLLLLLLLLMVVVEAAEIVVNYAEIRKPVPEGYSYQQIACKQVPISTN